MAEEQNPKKQPVNDMTGFSRGYVPPGVVPEGEEEEEKGIAEEFANAMSTKLRGGRKKMEEVK